MGRQKKRIKMRKVQLQGRAPTPGDILNA